MPTSGSQPDDLTTMLAHTPMSDGDVVTPRRNAMDAAFDRLEAS